MQSTARKNELPLDKMSLTCEVSKKYPGESMQVPRDGAYVHGLFIEGARWVFFLNSTYLCFKLVFDIQLLYSIAISKNDVKDQPFKEFRKLFTTLEFQLQQEF